MLGGCQPADRAASSAAGPPAPPSPAVARAPAEPGAGRLDVTVKRVIDGDTVLVSGLPEGTALVRLIGVNAPETGTGRTTRECFGAEAARWLQGQAPRGSRLSLAFDAGARDRFGRRLAYAYRPDGLFLNAALVANGYATTMTIRPNVRHAAELQALERGARSQHRGLWAVCPDAPPPAPLNPRHRRQRLGVGARMSSTSRS